MSQTKALFSWNPNRDLVPRQEDSQGRTPWSPGCSCPPILSCGRRLVLWTGPWSNGQESESWEERVQCIFASWNPPSLLEAPHLHFRRFGRTKALSPGAIFGPQEMTHVACPLGHSGSGVEPSPAKGHGREKGVSPLLLNDRWAFVLSSTGWGAGTTSLQVCGGRVHGGHRARWEDREKK